jgi:hypothetical protein
VRAALDRNAEALDEALLSNAFAYIKKASDDRFDSLVALLQKVGRGLGGFWWRGGAAARFLPARPGRAAARGASRCPGRPRATRPSPQTPAPAAPPPRRPAPSTRPSQILQLYAARALRGPETSGVDGFLNELLYAEEAQWEPMIRGAAAEGSVAEASFMEALQKKMEATVLGLQSGSYAQRVQAEYLKEVEGRAAAVFKALAAGGGGGGSGGGSGGGGSAAAAS